MEGAGMNLPPTLYEGRYVIQRVMARLYHTLPLKKASRWQFLSGFWALLASDVAPATLFGALHIRTFFLRPPLRYPAQTATLSSANRYVIRRKPLQVDMAITWLERRGCSDITTYSGVFLGNGVGSGVLAQGSIPV